MNEVLNNAIQYANAGFKVFPLKENTKCGQVCRSWKEEATTNLEQINQWFSSTDYNVGVRTGDGLVVIDIDNKNDKNGYKSIEPFLKEFPPTRIVRTVNDGWHMYYLVNRSISCKVNLYEGIDIRGEGGYVVGIGSSIDGKTYTISYHERIAEANEAVYKFLEGQKVQEKLITVTNSINEGQRNDYLFKMACSLQHKGFSDNAIKVCLIEENQNKCNPPLAENEVIQILKSSLKYEKGIIDIKEKSKSEGSYTVSQLLSLEEIDEPDIVEDMISIGLTLLGAPQKSGKTFFGLQLADAIATGNNFLGKKVQKGTALYLAFEDKKNKIRARLKTMKVEMKDNFIVDILKPNPNYDVENRIKEELARNSNLKIVIIDTFAKIRKSKDRDYESEYAEATLYHELAYKYHIAIVLVTHVKKEIDTNHPFDSIYGSRGLTAGSDSILVMYKTNHLSRNRQLAIQGKDIPDDELTLYLNDNHILEVAENEIEEVFDENLMKVVNYVIKEKKYIGSHEALCSKLALPLTGKGLQMLLSRSISLLQSTFISYEKAERTSKARQIKLNYYGEDNA